MQLERERKKAKGAQAKIADGKRRAEKPQTAVRAEVPALYTEGPRDPRLTKRGQFLSASLSKAAMVEVTREVRRTEAAKRVTRRA